MTQARGIQAAVWALLLAALVQLALVAQDQVIPAVTRLSSFRHSSPILRGASIAFGDGFADYVAFLREQAPLDAIVALPPVADEPVLGHTGMMQYLLFPRRTTNCPKDWGLSQCRDIFAGEGIFILRVNGFPGDEWAESLDKRYIPFSSRLGLYRPRSAPMPDPSP